MRHIATANTDLLIDIMYGTMDIPAETLIPCYHAVLHGDGTAGMCNFLPRLRHELTYNPDFDAAALEDPEERLAALLLRLECTLYHEHGRGEIRRAVLAHLRLFEIAAQAA